MSEDSTPTPLEWVNSLQAHLVLAEQHGRTSVQVNVSDFEVLTDVEMRLLTLEAEVERLQDALREEQGESLRQAEIARDALAEVERLQVRERELEALVRELADDLYHRVTNEYEDTLDQPVMRRRYERDMVVVARALAAVSAETEDDDE